MQSSIAMILFHCCLPQHNLMQSSATMVPLLLAWHTSWLSQLSLLLLSVQSHTHSAMHNTMHNAVHNVMHITIRYAVHMARHNAMHNTVPSRMLNANWIPLLMSCHTSWLSQASFSLASWEMGMKACRLRMRVTKPPWLASSIFTLNVSLSCSKPRTISSLHAALIGCRWPHTWAAYSVSAASLLVAACMAALPKWSWPRTGVAYSISAACLLVTRCMMHVACHPVSLLLSLSCAARYMQHITEVWPNKTMPCHARVQNLCFSLCHALHGTCIMRQSCCLRVVSRGGTPFPANARARWGLASCPCTQLSCSSCHLHCQNAKGGQ